MKALFIKDWKLLKNQGKMFGAVLVFYGLLAVMDNSMGQSILGFFPFLFGFFKMCIRDSLNTMNSRAGAQVPFSSINYGTCTSPEARMAMKNLLKVTDAGLGNGETAIFPVQIFKVKEGINYLSLIHILSRWLVGSSRIRKLASDSISVAVCPLPS